MRISLLQALYVIYAYCDDRLLKNCKFIGPNDLTVKS